METIETMREERDWYRAAWEHAMKYVDGDRYRSLSGCYHCQHPEVAERVGAHK
jgi:hypothetical protein